MKIENNISQIVSLLETRGWSLSNDQNSMFVKLSNHFLFVDTVVVSIPTNVKLSDFPEQLKQSLNRLCQIEPELKKNHLVKSLVCQAKNMTNKFSKIKSEWILVEPGSKYMEHEIPNLYVPEKSYV